MTHTTEPRAALAPLASSLKTNCDYGLCGRLAVLIVQTQADAPNRVLGEERPMCITHALTHPHRGTSVAVVDNVPDHNVTRVRTARK